MLLTWLFLSFLVQPTVIYVCIQVFGGYFHLSMLAVKTKKSLKFETAKYME